MKSMTGFGSHVFTSSRLWLEVSVRSVNGRFLENRVHIPREYVFLENKVKKLISQFFIRGTVDVYINRRFLDSSKKYKVSYSKALASEWVEAFRDLSKHLKLSEEPTMKHLIVVPEILNIEEFNYQPVEEERHVLQSIKKAFQKCEIEKKREGASLKKEINQLLTELKKKVKIMEELKADANKKLQDRYQQRLKKIHSSVEVDPQRLAQEIVIQIDKADISEEIARLNEHLRSFFFLVKGVSVQGKKLDFYSQELLREINTIGSKSAIAQLTQVVVDAKTIVEQIREQVQNIE